MRRRRKTLEYVTVWLLGVTLIICNTSNAVTLVKGIQYTLFGGDCYYKPGDVYAAGEVFTYEDKYMGNIAKMVGQIRLDGDSSYNYEIRGGFIELTPSKRLLDLSYTTTNILNRYIAKGLFEKGATLTISGYITNAGGTRVLSNYGTLIEAAVTADFYGLEQSISPNFLDFQLNLEITGGELFTGRQTGFALSPTFISDITFRYCTQFGLTSLRNFTSDIGYAQPSIIQINSVGSEPVPEPATIVLFALTGIGILIRKNRKE